MGMKTTKLMGFPKPKRKRKKVGLIPNFNREIRKTRTRTWNVQNKNSIRFYCKNKTRTKQIYDKKKYSKTNVEQIKSSGESFFYLFPLNT